MQSNLFYRRLAAAGKHHPALAPRPSNTLNLTQLVLMIPSDSRRLFEQAFDTFKAFDDLTMAGSSWEDPAFPTSIWQIVQDLLIWQAQQLAQLGGTAQGESFDEKQS
jgi:hypothetical protein